VQIEPSFTGTSSGQKLGLALQKNEGKEIIKTLLPFVIDMWMKIDSK
jgi:hypothetical protein